MKLIYAGTGVQSLDYGNFLYNCTRNVKCERPFFVPIRNWTDLMFFADLSSVGKPDSYHAEVLDLCRLQTGGEFNDDFNDDFNTGDNIANLEYPLVLNNLVIGQQPSLAWYGVFGGAVPVLPEGVTVRCFVIRLTIEKNGNDYIFYSQQLCFPLCETLMYLQGCYPNEEVGADAVDCNGIYYGFPVNEDIIGDTANFRYFHWAYVRMGSVTERSNKLSLTAFNSQRIYKSQLNRESLLQFELVPTFMKDILIGIFTRGNIKIDGAEWKLAEEQTIGMIDEDSKLWKADIILDSLCKQYFSCNASDCTLPVTPCTDQPVGVEWEFDEVFLFTFLGGTFQAGSSIEWEVREKESGTLIDTGIINAEPLQFSIDPAVHPDFDPDNECYTVRWRKICANEQPSIYTSVDIGNCEPPVPLECKTYHVTSPNGGVVDFTDCNGDSDAIIFGPGEQADICALEDSIESDDPDIIIDFVADGCEETFECTSWGIQAGIGGCTIQWEGCSLGEANSTFISQGGQTIVCARNGTLNIIGNHDITANNGDCS